MKCCIEIIQFLHRKQILTTHFLKKIYAVLVNTEYLISLYKLTCYYLQLSNQCILKLKPQQLLNTKFSSRQPSLSIHLDLLLL